MSTLVCVSRYVHLYLISISQQHESKRLSYIKKVNRSLSTEWQLSISIDYVAHHTRVRSHTHEREREREREREGEREREREGVGGWWNEYAIIQWKGAKISWNRSKREEVEPARIFAMRNGFFFCRPFPRAPFKTYPSTQLWHRYPPSHYHRQNKTNFHCLILIFNCQHLLQPRNCSHDNYQHSFQEFIYIKKFLL